MGKKDFEYSITGLFFFKLERILSDGEIRVILNSLQALPGVEGTELDAQLEKITVSYNPDLTGPRTFIDVIEETYPGRYKATLFQPGGRGRPDRSEEIKWYYKSFLWSLVFTVPVFLLAMVFMLRGQDMELDAGLYVAWFNTWTLWLGSI